MEIYIEQRGGWKGKILFSLYTVNKDCEPGHGIRYNSVGKPYTFAWCHPCKEYILPKDLKRKFMYSFKHGSCDISVEYDLAESDIDIWSILRDEHNYEYEWVLRKDVAIQKKIESLEINTKDDVIKNKDLLFNNPISHSVACMILAAYGIQQTTAYNGEIGIAAMSDFIKVSIIKDTIENDDTGTEREEAQA